LTLECNLKGNQKVFLLEQGKSASCCRSYPEPFPDNIDVLITHWKSESQQLLQGIPVASCEVCWKHENQGLLSYRQLASPILFNEIELIFSNLCNHMCSYCSPKFSSVWQESIDTHGMFKNVSASVKNNFGITKIDAVEIAKWENEIIRYIMCQPPDSVNLKLLGGEPLMQFKNLQKLLTMGKDSINLLRIHTNLNPPTNKFLVWLLDYVASKKLYFNISIDSTPEYNHVPRSGFDQEKFLNNLDLLNRFQVGFNFVCVISILGIFDLPNFVKWAKNTPIYFFKINNPDCLDPCWLPSHILEKIHHQFGEQTPPKIFQELYENRKEPIDLKLFEQYNYLLQYFDRTGIVPTKIDNPIFQEYWEWIKQRVAK
jgi:sulfatase maturation enzyme AslB (radical SAM superfamily)